MKNFVAVISGGMGGIGRAIAKRLAQDGYSIAALGTSIDQQFIASLPGAGHAGYACDIKDSAVLNSTMLKIAEQSSIRICVHAAVSPLIRKKASAITADEFKQQFEVTAFGGLNLFQAVIPLMKEQNFGRIVGITSASLEPNAQSGSMAGYICAKFALRGLLRELARELMPLNITVNAVAPDFVRTPLHSDLPERAFELIKEKMGKELVTPENVADTVAFLCSEAAQSITGTSLTISQGQTMDL